MEISEVIADIVTRIDNTIEGVYDSGNITNYCETKWARPGREVTDEIGNTYLVNEVNFNQSLDVSQTNLPLTPLDGLTFITAPYFVPGTKLAANREWTISTPDLTAKTPLIWLLEIIRERRFGKDSTILFESDVRIFFLDETNIKEFYTEDHRREVVKPMIELAEAFLDVVRNDRSFVTFDDYQLITFSRFGVEAENGVFQNILDANLSGVELQFTLSKYKENCKC